MTPQQYCLRWKFHHSNLQTMFTQLLDRGCFCDVTIACEGQTLRAHRVVLCACSTYFDSILTNCSLQKEPIIMMRDCKFEDIKSLVEFMYKGEINVEHNNLASILKTAVDLRIKGLADVHSPGDMGKDGDAVINQSRKQFAAAVAASGQSSQPESSTMTRSTGDSTAKVSHPAIVNPNMGPHSHIRDNTLGPDVSTNLLQARLSGASEHQPHIPQPYPVIMGQPMHSLPAVPMMSANTNYHHQTQHQQQIQLEQNYQLRNQVHLPMHLQSSMPIKRKRGRPPLDGEFDSYSTPKITHVESGAHADSFIGQHHMHDPSDPPASSMVEAMLDDDSGPADTQLPPIPIPEPIECPAEDVDNKTNIVDEPRKSPGRPRIPLMPEKGKTHQIHEDETQNGDDWHDMGLEMQMDYEEDTLAGRLIPKLERSDTPDSEHTESSDLVEEQSQSALMELKLNSSQFVSPDTKEFFTPEEMEEWKDVIQMNDYLTRGRRQQFWDERFTIRVMESIKNKDLEMKKAASLLGVSYGTLYGRYRETYGCLKQIATSSNQHRNAHRCHDEAVEDSLFSTADPGEHQLLDPLTAGSDITLPKETLQHIAQLNHMDIIHNNPTNDSKRPSHHPCIAQIAYRSDVGPPYRRPMPQRRFSVYEPHTFIAIPPKYSTSANRNQHTHEPNTNFEYSQQLRKMSMQQNHNI